MLDLKVNNLVVICCLLLLIPALFINLGLPAIKADEPTRANVAMEMMYTGDYIVSTIGGNYYYKKPPLFNWILVGIFTLTESKSEFVIRLAALIPLLLFSLRIFTILRKEVPIGIALLVAFMNITNGRMLYYDSMLGHIDILYAWITFESFVLLYNYRNNINKALIGFYILHAIAFMLKGLPSLLFPAFTLLAFAWQYKQWTFLWRAKHILAIIIGLSIPTIFFSIYAQYNALDGWIFNLWDQSKQRTVLDKTWWESIRHLFTFPLDHIMHLAPWSLLVILLFRKGFSTYLQQFPIVTFLGWVLVFNIPVYWASPGYYPRYLFMFYPIVFAYLTIALAFALQSNAASRIQLIIKWFNTVVGAGMIGSMMYAANQAPLWQAVIVSLLAIVFVTLSWQKPVHLIWCLMALVITSRIAFNWYVLPYRTQTGLIDRSKNYALEIVAKAAHKPLYIAEKNAYVLEHNFYYYIERERKEILVNHPIDTTSLFIIDPTQYKHFRTQVLLSFNIEFQNMPLQLVQFKSISPDSSTAHINKPDL